MKTATHLAQLAIFSQKRLPCLAFARNPSMEPRGLADRLFRLWPLAISPSGSSQIARKKFMADKLSEEERLALQAELEHLRQEHRDLDAAIEALSHLSTGDRLQIQRLKKRKLNLRDRMSFVEDQLTPDIIA